MSQTKNNKSSIFDIVLLIFTVVSIILGSFMLFIFISNYLNNLYALADLEQAALIADNYYIKNKTYKIDNSNNVANDIGMLTTLTITDKHMKSGDKNNADKIFITNQNKNSVTLCTAAQKVQCYVIDTKAKIKRKKGNSKTDTKSLIDSIKKQDSVGKWR